MLSDRRLETDEMPGGGAPGDEDEEGHHGDKRGEKDFRGC